MLLARLLYVPQQQILLDRIERKQEQIALQIQEQPMRYH